jgi:hypothetical protein
MEQEMTTKVVTNVGERCPAGSARARVRGFAASIVASASRLNAIAAERAASIAITIQRSACLVGSPDAASIAPHSANGRAKMECSHLIISSVIAKLRSTGTLQIVKQFLFSTLREANG